MGMDLLLIFGVFGYGFGEAGLPAPAIRCKTGIEGLAPDRIGVEEARGQPPETVRPNR